MHEKVRDLPSLTEQEKGQILAGAPCKPGNATLDSDGPMWRRVPAFLKGCNPLSWRILAQNHIQKLMQDHKVHCVLDLSPSHGQFARAAIDLEVRIISVTFNPTHTGFLLRAIDAYLLTKMGTTGHRLFKSDLTADIHELYSHLFKENGPVEFPPDFDSDDELCAAFSE